jgi:hypothetical protein
MNTANLQLEGMLLAMYALLDAIKRKGILNEQEIEEALRQAEMTAVAEVGDRAEISKSNGEAICFPIRFLREAIALKERSWGRCPSSLLFGANRRRVPLRPGGVPNEGHARRSRSNHRIPESSRERS